MNEDKPIKNTQWHDPVVAEIHAVREQLAKEYGNDLAAYSLAAQARSEERVFYSPNNRAVQEQNTQVKVPQKI